MATTTSPTGAEPCRSSFTTWPRSTGPWPDSASRESRWPSCCSAAAVSAFRPASRTSAASYYLHPTFAVRLSLSAEDGACRYLRDSCSEVCCPQYWAADGSRLGRWEYLTGRSASDRPASWSGCSRVAVRRVWRQARRWVHERPRRVRPRQPGVSQPPLDSQLHGRRHRDDADRLRDREDRSHVKSPHRREPKWRRCM